MPISFDLQRSVGRWRIPMLIVLAAAIDLGLGVAYLGDVLLDAPLGGELSRWFDLDAERNLTTWYSSIKLAALGLILFMLATVFLGDRLPRAWLMMVLALAFLGLSFDEFAGVHERIGEASDRFLPGGDRANTIFSATGIWFLIGIPVLAGLLWITLAMSRLWGNPRATRLFVIGLLIFIGSAAGLEILTNFTAGFAKTLQITAEECGEMLGVTVMLWAVYDLMTSHGIVLFASVGRDSPSRSSAARPATPVARETVQ